VTWDQIVNPAHDAGDVVTIIRPEIGVSANYVIDSLNIPLAASGLMDAGARTRTAVNA
jgi:hypothetical protein